jgi:cytochrome c553
MNKLRAFTISLTLLTALFSCQHEPEDLPGVPPVHFSEVEGILSTCSSNLSCHNGGENGPSLDNYPSVHNLVTDYKPMKSRLYKVLTIKNQNSESFMPRNAEPLSRQQIDIISRWILEGAKPE